MRFLRRLTTAAGATAIVALGAMFVPHLLQHMETFRVRDVRVEGNRFLTRAEVVRASGIDAAASIWDGTRPWERALAEHVMIERVRVRRSLPNTLIIEVVENEPVALLPMPTLEPVDRHGRLLPIDPARHRLDLPVVRASPDPARADFSSSKELRLLLSELDRLHELDPELVRRTSELSVDGQHDIVLHLYAPEVEFRYRPPIRADRLQEGRYALSDALKRGGSVAVVDLRFEGQVVVRSSDAQ